LLDSQPTGHIENSLV